MPDYNKPVFSKRDYKQYQGDIRDVFFCHGGKFGQSGKALTESNIDALLNATFVYDHAEIHTGDEHTPPYLSITGQYIESGAILLTSHTRQVEAEVYVRPRLTNTFNTQTQVHLLESFLDSLQPNTLDD